MTVDRPPPQLSRIGRSPIAVLVGVMAMVLALAAAMNASSYDVWGAFWVGPVLLAATVPLARWMANREDDPGVGRLILLAFVAKVIVGSVLRYIAVNQIYGSGDSLRYSDAGKVLAPAFRDLQYENLGKLSGTRFIEVVTGQVYAGIGPTQLGGFLVFSWFAFVGLVLLVRAFRIAVPQGDHRRYRILVLFFPTLLFWPSSIGKDAWMLLCIGVVAYGLAKVLTGHLLGGIALGLGLWGATIVRPHVALLLGLAGMVAIVVRVVAPNLATLQPRRGRALVVGVVLVGGVAVLTAQAEEFFGIDSLDPEAAEEVQAEVVRRTGQGGSEFDAPSADTPGGYLLAFVTVLFRPFPLEGGSGLSQVAAAEGLLLAGVAVVSFGRLSRAPALAARAPYVLLAIVFILGFVYAFSAIENFGILVRQRAQVLPFVLALLALPARPRRSAGNSGSGEPTMRHLAGP